MKNVSRNRIPIPLSLQKNASKWTKELLKAIEKNNEHGVPIPERLYKRYDQEDIKEALKKMYSDDDMRCYCCYCESEIDVVSYPNIEHRKPKAKTLYPELTYDWHNLHLACTKCNIAKGDKFDENEPILDAVLDVPIKKHLGYKLSTIHGVYRETLTKKGITTVKHTDLDRKTLRRARHTIYNEVINAIQEIKKLGNNPRAYTAKKMLGDKCSGEYGSLIEWLLDKWNVAIN